MSFRPGAPLSLRVKKEFRMTEAVALYLDGYSQKGIEDEFTRRGYPTDRSTISKYLKQTRQEWKEKRMQDMDAILDRELAALDKMERDAAELFEKFNPNNEESGLDEPFDCSKEAAEWTKTRLKIMEQRHKLLGLYKPVKLDIESKNENVNVTEKTEATRSSILGRLSKNVE